MPIIFLLATKPTALVHETLRQTSVSSYGNWNICMDFLQSTASSIDLSVDVCLFLLLGKPCKRGCDDYNILLNKIWHRGQSDPYLSLENPRMACNRGSLFCMQLVILQPYVVALSLSDQKCSIWASNFWTGNLLCFEIRSSLLRLLYNIHPL